jgi:hypothetical protein
MGVSSQRRKIAAGK